MKAVEIKAVLIAGIVDVVLTNVLSIPVVVLALVGIAQRHLSADRLQATLQAVLQTDPAFHYTLVAIGGACSIFAGYLAARIAKHDEILNGALSAWFCVAIGIWGLLFASGLVRRLDAILDLPFAVIAGATGGYIQHALKMRAALEPTS